MVLVEHERRTRTSTAQAEQPSVSRDGVLDRDRLDAAIGRAD